MTYFGNIADPATGKQVFVSEFNDLRASPLVRLVGPAFIGTTKDTNFWTETDIGTGTVTQTGGTVVLATGATANSTVQYQTVRMARFVSGAENTFRAMLKVGDTGTVNNIRNWGAFTATDGFFFQLSGANLNIVSRLASSDTPVAKASWNVSTNFTLDTNYHLWEIRITEDEVHFYIDHHLMHSLSVESTSVKLTQTLTFPVTLQNNNSGGLASNITMTVSDAFIMRTGQLNTETIYKNISGVVTGQVLKYGPGRLHRIVVGGLGTSIIVYDNTTNSAPIISTMTVISGASSQIFCMEFNCPFSTGLTITTTGASTNITVIYE